MTYRATLSDGFGCAARGAGGLTADQLSELLDRRFRSTLVDPETSSPLRYAPFYVLGEVVNPGTYPYEPDLTVLAAVQAAGGFTHRARRNWVQIRRAGANEEHALELDDDLVVSPGDIIRIEGRTI